jgi:hypothetical protein
MSDEAEGTEAKGYDPKDDIVLSTFGEVKRKEGGTYLVELRQYKKGPVKVALTLTTKSKSTKPEKAGKVKVRSLCRLPREDLAALLSTLFEGYETLDVDLDRIFTP